MFESWGRGGGRWCGREVWCGVEGRGVGMGVMEEMCERG